MAGIEQPKWARIRGAARSTGSPLKGLYQALGAHEAGAVDSAEVLRMAGYEGLTDIAHGEKEYVAMEMIIDC